VGQAKYQRDGDPRTSRPGFGVTVHKDALLEPLRWRKPCKVVVNSMSIEHARVSAAFVARVFAVMRCRQTDLSAVSRYYFLCGASRVMSK
jgi:protein gp37